MKTLTKTAAIAAVATFGFAAAAQAQTTTLQPGPGQYTFSGTADLSANGINANNCTLTLVGNVSKNSSGDVTIDVVDGSVQGGFPCGNVSLGFSPAWTTTVAQADLPTSANPSKVVSGTFENVQVFYRIFGRSQCNGSTVDVMFTNGNPISQPSSFIFNDDIGECSVNGTIDAQSDINVIVQ